MAGDRKNEVGERLKQAHPHETSKLFAARLGLSENGLSNYETGKTSPRLDLLIRVQELTGVSLDWLASGEGDPFGGPHQPIDVELLARIIEVVEEETPDVGIKAKSRLIARFYADKIKTRTAQVPPAAVASQRGAKRGSV